MSSNFRNINLALQDFSLSAATFREDGQSSSNCVNSCFAAVFFAFFSSNFQFFSNFQIFQFFSNFQFFNIFSIFFFKFMVWSIKLKLCQQLQLQSFLQLFVSLPKRILTKCIADRLRINFKSQFYLEIKPPGLTEDETKMSTGKFVQKHRENCKTALWFGLWIWFDGTWNLTFILSFELQNHEWYPWPRASADMAVIALIYCIPYDRVLDKLQVSFSSILCIKETNEWLTIALSLLIC